MDRRKIRGGVSVNNRNSAKNLGRRGLPFDRLQLPRSKRDCSSHGMTRCDFTSVAVTTRVCSPAQQLRRHVAIARFVQECSITLAA